MFRSEYARYENELHGYENELHRYENKLHNYENELHSLVPIRSTFPQKIPTLQFHTLQKL